MDTRWSRARRTLAAVLSAALIGIVGVGAIAPETAQAAGVAVDHAYAGTAAVHITSADDD